MREVNSLANKLKEYLPPHQDRIKFMAKFIPSLLKVDSVNLCLVVEHLDTASLTGSSYRRIPVGRTFPSAIKPAGSSLALHGTSHFMHG